MLSNVKYDNNNSDLKMILKFGMSKISSVRHADIIGFF